MNKKKITLVAKILTVISAVFCSLVFTAGNILLENNTAVNGFLNATTQIVYQPEDAEEQDTTYHKTVFNSVAEVKANGEALCEEVVAEGATLLKNEGGALPAAKGSKVNLYSASSVNIAVSGGGSSATSAQSVDLKTALEDPSVGLDVNDALWQWYKNNASTYGRKSGTGIGARNTIDEAPWSVLPSDKSDRAALGVFVLTRVGSEDADALLNNGDTSDYTNGNYLTLSPAEITVLQGMKAEKDAGRLGGIVVIMNTTNQVESFFVDDEAYGVDAVLWCGTLGSTGVRAVADILVGNVNPSGRLSDTFWAQHRYNPVNANFGDFAYAGTLTNGEDASRLAIHDYGSGQWRAGYVVYQEGVYVGYRYTETRYEDVVLGRANAGTYDYGQVVSYPFGYGLSYTTFSYEDFSVSEYDAASDSYTVSVTVRNTGSVAGKEVVQVYLQKPYTAYDVEHGVEKPSVELVGFAKTALLAPSATERVEIKVDREYFASYDSDGAKTYILDAGDYYLTAARDAHDAVNNILAEKGKTMADGMTADGNAALAKKETLSFGSAQIDKTTYATTDDPVKSGYKSEPSAITNKFDYADINRYEHKGSNAVGYVTRNDWNGTASFGMGNGNELLNNQVRLTINAEMEYDIREEEYLNPAADDTAYPVYGSQKTCYSLIDLRAYSDDNADPSDDVFIEYDNPMWEDLLDQLTWEDTVALLECGERMTSAVPGIAKLQTIDHNGAVGVNQSYGGNAGVNRGFAVMNNDPNKSAVPCAYPSNGVCASTYNVELMKRYGEAWGEDALWAGYAGLYGPGLNMHRSPYGGRNFEYYSEDSFLSGRICSRVSEGIEGKGVYVYLKHAILNDQEAGRRTISTWANEQTIREIYLRPFEMAIEEGGARCVMFGLNKIGPTSNVLSGIGNDLLREEFGMRGFVVSDYQHDAQSQIMPAAHTKGTDLPDRNYTKKDAYSRFRTGHGEIAWAMREAAHHILYTVVHSAAMNGLSSATKIITLTPDWEYWLDFAKASSLILLIGSAALLISCYAFPALPDALARRMKKGEKGGETKSETKVPMKSQKTAAPKSGTSPCTGERTKEPYYVLVIRGVIGIGLAVAVFINSVVVAVHIGANQDAIKLYSGSSQRINETAGGDGIVSHVFQAETASFVGRSYTGEGTLLSGKSVATSYVVSGGFGGGICLAGIGPKESSEEEENNSVTFRLRSDKKVMVAMTCRLTGATVDGAKLSDYCDLTVNGKEPRNYDTTVVPRDWTGTWAYNGFYMVETDVTINLDEGENEIVFAIKRNFGFDYIDIKTSATLTQEQADYWWKDGEVSVDVAPTENGGGQISITDSYTSASYAVPTLSDGLISGVYRKVAYEEENKADVLFGDSSLLMRSIGIAPHTLTLQSDLVSFAGGEKSATVRATYATPTAEWDVSEGNEFVAWYDVDDPSVFWKTETFVMPDRDLTIAPLIEDWNYAVDATDQWQRVCLLPAEKTGTTPIRTDKGTGFNMVVLRDSMARDILVYEGKAEVATTYHYGSVSAGYAFLTMNEVNLTMSGTKTVSYVLENKGNETLSFNLYQANSSADPKNAANPKATVTLAAGEQTSVSFAVNFQNGNLLSYFEFLSPVSSMSLAVTEKVVLGNKLPAANYTATIASGATFVDGSTVASVSAGNSLPSVVLTGDNAAADRRLTGWIVDDGTAKTFVKADAFIMPEKNVTLTPYAPVKFDNSAVNGAGPLDLSEEGAVGNFAFSYISHITVDSAGKSSLYMLQGDKVGTEYTFTGQTGEYFRIVRAYKTTSEQARTVTYTLKNNGSETLVFTMHQVNSGTDTSVAPSSGTITLAAGESTTVTLQTRDTNGNAYQNSNLMCLITLGADATAARLWISAEASMG